MLPNPRSHLLSATVCRPMVAVLMVASLLFADVLDAQRRRRSRGTPPETENIKHFRLQSKLLTKFWGRDMFVQAGVVLPPEHDPKEKLPVCYNIHGFGGSYRAAWSSGRGARVLSEMLSDEAKYPRMIYVYLQAHFPLGHHEFADSVNNGPWGQALTTEFIPALEKKFGAHGKPRGRFLTGHSSGGWSSLWLQVTYPEFFNGTWSTAPDSVDFRDFTGIDIYKFENAYKDPQGNPIQLVRRGDKWIRTIEAFVQREISRRSHGGQFASFDAVFSPRGEDGQPMPMFDRKTGKIDPVVAKAWEKYDIGLILRKNWKTLGPKLDGKLRVYVGTLDTFRLEGALRLMAKDLKTLGSDARIVFAVGRSHGSLLRPHKLWPAGLMEKIHRDMRARFDAK